MILQSEPSAAEAYLHAPRATTRRTNMPRHKSIVALIRDMVRDEVGAAIAGLFGSAKPKATRRRRGKWRPGGPGRPPLAVKAARAKKSKG
jgi:hypothetical protein